MTTELLTKLHDLHIEVKSKAYARDAANVALIDAKGALEQFKIENKAALAELRKLMDSARKPRSDKNKPRGPRAAPQTTA